MRRQPDDPVDDASPADDTFADGTFADDTFADGTFAGHGSCRVWVAHVSFETSALVPELDAIEQARRARLHRVADRDRFTAAAVLLRRAAATELGVAPHDVVIDRTCDTCGRPHGRPTIGLADGTDPGLDVSVTHAGSFVAVAVSTMGRVGVDIETITRDHRELIEIACAPEERDSIRSGGDFAVVWTRKEAVLKALGSGLRRPPSDVVTSPPDRPPVLRRLGDGPTPACRLWDLPLDPDHVGTVAVLSAAPVPPDIVDAAGVLLPSRRGDAWA